MFANFVHNYDPVEFRRCHVEFVGQLKHKHLYHLVGEVDRCMKKVGEGVEAVEEIWQKFINATIPNQKEKFENDLKKEIKKLQRLREQIKNWISSTDIKDKTMLFDTKKLIETQMERFKGIEREMKIKTYSKIGLESAQKVDPIVQETEEVNSWISNWMEELDIQIDHYESETELLVANMKKKGQPEEQERLDRLQNKIERHKFHIKKLETLMKMLDELGSDVNYDAVRIKKFLTEVKGIKDDIDYYLEANDEPDFRDNDMIYSDIEGIDEFEQSIPFVPSIPTDESAGIIPDLSENSPQDSGETMKEHCLDSNHSLVVETSLEDVRKDIEPQTNGNSPGNDQPKLQLQDNERIDKPSVQLPSTSTFKDVLARYIPVYVNGRGKADGQTHTQCKSASLNGSEETDIGESLPQVQINLVPGVSEISAVSISPSEGCSSMSSPIDTDVNGNFIEIMSMDNRSNLLYKNQSEITDDRNVENCVPLTQLKLPNDERLYEFCDPPQQPDIKPCKKEAFVSPLMAVAPLGQVSLEASQRHRFEKLMVAEHQLPMTSCLERLGQILPRETYACPKYYPQSPLSTISVEEHYELLDNDTLFFIFYYLGGSKAQYLAAKKLKERMWRFHTKYLTWFQRFEMPSQSTEDFEFGTYLYFDIDKWRQDKKENFHFEYKYLERDL